MLMPRQIIAEAWSITLKEAKLRRWGFVAAFFETTRSVELLLYQTYYLYYFFQGIIANWLSFEILLFQKLCTWLFAVTLGFTVLLLILQLFVPTLSTGAIIGLAAKSYKKEPVKGGTVLALYNFFPILEVHGMFVMTSFALIFTCFSLILRYSIGNPVLRVSGLLLLGFISIISIIFRFFASFSEEAVVINREGVFAAVGTSFKLVISHLGRVMFLILLMLVISIRVVINTVLVLLIPLIAISLGSLLAFVLPPIIGFSIASVIGLALLLFATYFLTYLHVFKQTVWTITFMELKKEKDMDVIG
jgi:hypothetical protein